MCRLCDIYLGTVVAVLSHSKVTLCKRSNGHGRRGRKERMGNPGNNAIASPKGSCSHHQPFFFLLSAFASASARPLAIEAFSITAINFTLPDLGYLGTHQG